MKVNNLGTPRFITKINMKGIDNFSSRKDWESYLWLMFLGMVGKSKSPKAVKNLLESLLSSAEKRDVAKRLAAVALLREGKSYKEISRILWISPATISALKKSLMEQSGYRSGRYYSEKSSKGKRKRMKGLPPLTILDYWLNLPWPKKTGRGRWKFLNYQG